MEDHCCRCVWAPQPGSYMYHDQMKKDRKKNRKTESDQGNWALPLASVRSVWISQQHPVCLFFFRLFMIRMCVSVCLFRGVLTQKVEGKKGQILALFTTRRSWTVKTKMEECDGCWFYWSVMWMPCQRMMGILLSLRKKESSFEKKKVCWQGLKVDSLQGVAVHR